MVVKPQQSKVVNLIIGVTLLVFLWGIYSSNEIKEAGEGSVPSVVVTNYTEEAHPLPYSEEDLYYVTQAIYFEAILEPEGCQLQVAQVIQTRYYSHKYPNTYREVVWQRGQFSYTNDGKNERMTNLRARAKAERVARLVLGGYSLDTTEGSLYYHNPNLVDWEYKNAYQFVNRCGNHDFYKEISKGDWS